MGCRRTSSQVRFFKIRVFNVGCLKAILKVRFVKVRLFESEISERDVFESEVFESGGFEGGFSRKLGLVCQVSGVRLGFRVEGT